MALTWGIWMIPIEEVKGLCVYIHGFESFKYSTGNQMKTSTLVYGDRSTISFVYNSVSYDLTFYLGAFEHYDTLVQIMQCWRENRIEFSARSLFTDEYIREQVSLYANYPSL